jgi:hypothetical protein
MSDIYIHLTIRKETKDKLLIAELFLIPAKKCIAPLSMFIDRVNIHHFMCESYAPSL